MDDFDLDRHLDDAMVTEPVEDETAAEDHEQEPDAGMLDDGDDVVPDDTGDDDIQPAAEDDQPPAKEDELIPPQHWPLEKQEKFKALPRDAQQILLEQASEIERGAQEKFQQAAEMRQEVTRILEQLALQKTMPQDKQEVVEEQPPEDPIERIKWEAKREAIAEFQRQQEKLKEQEATESIQQRAAIIKAQVAKDPLKEHVMAAMGGWLETFPEAVDPLDPNHRTYRQIEYDRLNQHPDYYFAKYNQAREMIVQTLQKKEQGGQKQQAASGGQPPAGKQQKRTAPALEGGGSNVGDQQQVNKKAQKILKQIKAGKAGPDTLEKYLNAIDINL